MIQFQITKKCLFAIGLIILFKIHFLSKNRYFREYNFIKCIKHQMDIQKAYIARKWKRPELIRIEEHIIGKARKARHINNARMHSIDRQYCPLLKSFKI